MLKVIIKSLESKPLIPGTFDSLDPIRQLSWRRTINLNVGFFPDLLTLKPKSIFAIYIFFRSM